MCTSRTNDRLLGQIECYMDDLVDCFEEFIKKFMVVISVAVGTLVLMVMYVLKLIVGRRQITCVTTANPECFHKFCQVSIQDFTKSTANIHKPCTNTKSLVYEHIPNAKRTRTVSLQAIPTCRSNFDDNFTKETEMCVISKPCDNCKHTQVCDDWKRPRIEYKLTTTTREPSRSVSKTCTRHPRASQRSSKVITKQRSCCSLCCKD